MRILAINYYNLECAYKKPKEELVHQTWGISYPREKEHHVGTMTYSNIEQIEYLSSGNERAYILLK